MWQRAKRVINSYLDSLIDRNSNPEREVRDAVRSEHARLNDAEARAMGAAKMIERQIAEVELKMTGAGERARLAGERGDSAGERSARADLDALLKERDMLVEQLGKARASAERANSLRSERARQGDELAVDTHLTRMRETLAGVHSEFSSDDPAGVIEEMRQRINRKSPSPPPAVQEADRVLDAEARRSRVDSLLDHYKRNLDADSVSSDTPPGPQPGPEPAPAPEASGGPDSGKSLGPAAGPVRPID